MAHSKIDLSQLKILPLADRENKIGIEKILSLGHNSDMAVSDNISSLSLRVAGAVRRKRPVIWMMGAHAIRQGCSRFIIDLMERGVITHLATNASAAIHDFEFSFIGATCEDVEHYIRDGRFGNWEETGRSFNGAVSRGYKDGIGLGESIGRMIENEECGRMDFKHVSVFATAYRLGIPVTVHKGIGYDITDQHPSADFAAIGKTSGDDFLIFANSVMGLEGGVFLNIGSQVMGPEVYLKALSISRNIAGQNGVDIKHFTTAVFDLVPLGNWQEEKGIVDYRESGVMSDSRYYFRPLKSILIRTVRDGGESFYIEGDFADTIPQLYHSIMHLLF